MLRLDRLRDGLADVLQLLDLSHRIELLHVVRHDVREPQVSRKQRIRETALLRILGASKEQIRTILMVEYASLGVMAAMVSSGMALISSWALVHYLFHTAFIPSAAPILAAMFFVPCVTLITGWWSSRGVLDVAPLEILREEG